VVIAHRGASGYLPEHTLEAKAMAHAMNPHYIEQDIALTKDNRALVIHDHYLHTVSNVAQIYPKRKRKDGKYYVIDFTLKEIKKLKFFERFKGKNKTAVFPKRFPVKSISHFTASTLEEEIELIQGLNKSRGTNIGIYTELKSPWFHTKEGKNIGKVVMKILNKYGYNDKNSNCYVQCFDPNYLKYMKNTLKVKVKLVQLIAHNSWNETPGIDYNKMLSEKGLKEISTYAVGVGPWIDLIVRDKKKGNYHISNFVLLAHKYKLKVHPYTFRADSLPSYAKDMETLLRIFIYDVGVDGVFTDFPDRAVKFLQK